MEILVLGKKIFFASAIFLWKQDAEKRIRL